MKCTIEVEPKRDNDGSLSAWLRHANSQLSYLMKITPDMNPVGLDAETIAFLDPGREWVEKEAMALCEEYCNAYPANFAGWDETNDEQQNGYRAEARYMAGRMAEEMRLCFFEKRSWDRVKDDIAALDSISGGGCADAH